MWFLLRGITWPYFKKHWVITLLTLAGVSLGVGVYIAIELSSASLRTSLRRTVDKIAGKAQLEVSSGEAGVPEEIVDLVRGVPGVSAAQPIIEAVVRPEGAAEQSLMVLGVDFLGDRSIRDWDFDALSRFTASSITCGEGVGSATPGVALRGLDHRSCGVQRRAAILGFPVVAALSRPSKRWRPDMT